MKVTEQPKRYIDQSDGNPIEKIDPEHSRFETVEIKRLEDGIHVEALDGSRETIVEFTADLTEELYKGVEIRDDRRRRDVDDDLQDLIMLVGYCLVDTDVKGY